MRRSAPLLAVALGACVGPAPPTPVRTTAPTSAVPTPTVAQPPAPPPLVVEADYQLPVHRPPLRGGPACQPAPSATVAAKPSKKVRVYEFSAIPIAPVHRGPVIADRPRVGFPLLVDHLRAPFAAFDRDATACWKWAAARGAKATSRELDLVIDPSGAAHDLHVTGPDDELTGCLREVLKSPGSAHHRQPHSTHVRATLRFELAGQPAWTKLPRRPRPTTTSAANRAPACATGDVDERVVPFPLVVSDWDASRVVGPRQLRWVGGCVSYVRDTDKVQLRLAVESNRGALQGCYADALAREPGLAGELRVKASFSTDGLVSNTQTTGAGDETLHACITRAIDELWVDPTVGDAAPVETSFVFTLEPAPPAPHADDPAALLAAGDVDGALALWARRLTTPHTRLDGCRAHAGIVRAMMAAAPWLDDDRVSQAITNLARAARALPTADARICVGELAELLQRYTRAYANVTDPEQIDFPFRALERYEAVLSLASLLDWGSTLRWHRAVRLLSTPRAAEAESELAELAHDPAIGGQVTAWNTARATRTTRLGLCLR